MVTPAPIGLPGGLVTAVSPCVPPVLPVVFLAAGPGADAPATRERAAVAVGGPAGGAPPARTPLPQARNLHP
ncbi:hypothetical protein [Streptomyces omiyaensis]|uniref:hypothetical protein n=1 Tax=Streptomyces omiyaensis TaxID=68247 RepID=UPI00167A392C|nr:hypothetical protein [Streptomyces omiyaensis]GGY80939.1 hypothetical protein GCM10010363_72240 [Streptomyces omiyaensis]